MHDGELIGRGYALPTEGRSEAAEGHSERYMAARVRIVGAGTLREAWRRDGAERRTLLGERKRADRGAGLAAGPWLGLLAERPVINGRDAAERINRVLTFGGQPLTVRIIAPRFLNCPTRPKALFPYPARQVEIPAARRALVIALTYGKGRVVVTGEAGMLSAQILREGQASFTFGMNVPGFDNWQLALNIMHWLSGLLR